MTASRDCLKLIKQFGGYRNKAYLCLAGKWTIGYGQTGPLIGPNTTCTPESAEVMLADSVHLVALKVSASLKVPVPQPVFDALCSFVYNVGIGNFMLSTLLKRINLGDAPASNEFASWNKPKGVVLPWLTRRRAAEKELYDRS